MGFKSVTMTSHFGSISISGSAFQCTVEYELDGTITVAEAFEECRKKLTEYAEARLAAEKISYDYEARASGASPPNGRSQHASSFPGTVARV